MCERLGRVRPEGLRSTGTPLRARCSSVYLRVFLSYRSSEPELEEVDLWKIDPFAEGSASLFIDEGDGFTGERGRVRMLLSLVAHADEDWIMVGGPNTVDVTVERQMHTGGWAIFFRKDGRRYL